MFPCQLLPVECSIELFSNILLHFLKVNAKVIFQVLCYYKTIHCYDKKEDHNGILYYKKQTPALIKETLEYPKRIIQKAINLN